MRREKDSYHHQINIKTNNNNNNNDKNVCSSPRHSKFVWVLLLVFHCHIGELSCNNTKHQGAKKSVRPQPWPNVKVK